MSFGDRITVDDLQRARGRREPVTLSCDDLDALLIEIETADEEALSESFAEGERSAGCNCDEDAAYDDGYADGKMAARAEREQASA